MTVGKATRIRFKLTDRNSGEVKSGLTDVGSRRFWSRLPMSDIRRKSSGRASMGSIVSPIEAGVYYISVASDSIGLTHENPNMLILQVLPASDQARSTR